MVMMYIRYPLSLRQVEDILRAGHRHLPRDGSVLVEPVRSDVCGRDQEATPSSSVVFAMALAPGRGIRQDQWRDALSLACGRSRRRGAWGFRDEAPGSQGCAEIPEACDEALRPTVINCNRPASVIPIGNEIGNAADQECGRRLNNRAENSHQPFRRRERAMQRFRAVRTLQKFAAAHASIHNHFNHDRHLNHRDIFKQNRSAALAEWRQLAA